MTHISIELGQYQRMAESNMVGLLTWDMNGNVLEANDYVLNLVGYTREELREGKISWAKMTPEEYWDREKAAHAELFEKGVCTPFEKEYIRKDGSRVAILIGGAFLEASRTKGVSFVIEISELVRTRAALRASEALYRSLSEGSAAGIAHSDVGGYLRHANKTLCEWLELEDPKQVTSVHSLSMFTPETREMFLKQVAKRKEGLATTYEAEIVSLKGKKRQVLISGCPVFDQQGRVESMIATLIDTSELKAVSRVLQATIEAIPDGILVVEPGGKVICHNKRFLEILQVPPEAVEGKTVPEVMKHGVPLFTDPSELVRFREVNINSPDVPATPFALKDGRTVEILRKLETTSDGTLSIICMRDITDRKRVEEQLLQADRMAVVGMLAAGVAHEINNPLTHVIGGLELLSEKLQKSSALHPEDVRRALEPLMRSSARIADIVKDLKTFSRTGNERIETVDLRKAMESTFPLVNSEIKRRATLATRFDPAPLVRANLGRLEQVFVNLIINALQAMKSAKVGDNHLSIAIGTDERGWAKVEVSDNGVGIAPEKLRQIFEPFYTTKPVGMGTGLGLAICYSLVKRFGGEIEVKSQPNVGTLFRVTFPPAAVVANQPEATESGLYSRGRKSILVVDDEPDICEMLEVALSEDHEVRTAANGRAALEILASESAPDFVICDLMMPVMSGMEFYEAAVRLRPNLKERFLFITGGAVNEAAGDFLRANADRVLAKPFTIQQLRRAIG